jgi:hypothetical protein
LFGINPHFSPACPFIPLHFLLAQPPAGQGAINQIFYLKIKMMKAQQINPLFQIPEIKVSYQPKFKACERPKVNRSKDAFDILIRNWDKARINLCEQMYRSDKKSGVLW